MSDTLMRQWQMLRLIPRFPSKIGTPTLVQNLADAGFSVTTRTLQRDLLMLSEIYPLVRDERNKPFGWSWSANASVLDIPHMDSHTALTFWLASQHLKPLLPTATLKKLQPHMQAAAEVLNRIETGKGVPAWRNKVRVLPQGPALAAVHIDENVQQQVYDALLYHRRLSVRYQPRHAKEKAYNLNPLGLVLKGGVSYLVCTISDYTDIRLLTLHRLRDVQTLNTPTIIPDGFDLDAYIEAGEMGFMHQGDITLQALFTKGAALHLYERALSNDQIMQTQENGRVLLTATVQNTSELHWWLLGFGNQVEVLQPDSLRQTMIQKIQDAAQQYGLL
ncbi:MAG: WYL domain-containing protein [Ghiorsea sp.]|nr:WYL domain-containing protein [Ghiorsea sp.]MDQ7057379.1 WYL domain-containing protein [Ghiorsea sp.]